MTLENLLHEVQFVVDREGQRTAVQLDLAVWEEIISLLSTKYNLPANGTNAFDEVSYQQEMDELNRVLEMYAMDTGIPDLAQEHDHYIYGTPRRKSLRGLWQGVDITAEDIAEIRREMWGGRS